MSQALCSKRSDDGRTCRERGLTVNWCQLCKGTAEATLVKCDPCNGSGSNPVYQGGPSDCPSCGGTGRDRFKVMKQEKRRVEAERDALRDEMEEINRLMLEAVPKAIEEKAEVIRRISILTDRFAACWRATGLPLPYKGDIDLAGEIVKLVERITELEEQVNHLAVVGDSIHSMAAMETRGPLKDGRDMWLEARKEAGSVKGLDDGKAAG